jgi:hypothetical protein
MSQEKTKFVELCAMWRWADSAWKSSVVMDDRVSDFFQAVREQQYCLMLKPVMEKRSERSPDAFLIGVPAMKPRRS